MQGEIALLEPDLVSEFAGFSLTDQPAGLPGFAKEESEHPYLIDVDRGHLRIR
ncbi:MAG TPA: hypothetical protein VNE59_14500 [Burkholderiales bacterium]|nr:hypothetical protein [Burkholderiales bacterium]